MRIVDTVNSNIYSSLLENGFHVGSPLHTSRHHAVICNSLMTSNRQTSTILSTSSFSLLQSLGGLYKLVRALRCNDVGTVLGGSRSSTQVPIFGTSFTGGGTGNIVVGANFAVHAVVHDVVPEASLATGSAVIRARLGNGSNRTASADMSSSSAVLVPAACSTAGGRGLVLTCWARPL